MRVARVVLGLGVIGLGCDITSVEHGIGDELVLIFQHGMLF